MPRRSLFASLVFAAAVVLAPTTHAAAHAATPAYVAPAGSGALFLITGHGWGHGVGMGQWGAEGYALQSYTYDQILAADYPGTRLAKTSVRKIRVLLADGKKSLTVSSDQPITVVDGNGNSHTIRAGSKTFTTKLPYPAPLTLSPSSGSTLTLGRAYRGQIVIDVVGTKLRAINVLGLQQYLDGVVPAEMPSSWLPDALEAQAVASRSFALASRRAGAPFDVYTDSRSQAYLGVSAETPEATAAVDATAKQVLMYGNKIASAVFSSSTGGWTQSATDAWGGGGAPYLVSVKDPFDNISPWHDWGPVPETATTLKETLGLTGKPIDATVTRNSSKRVAELTVVTAANGTQTPTQVTGPTVASALQLRSTWFSVGVLSLQAPKPNPAVAPGTTVTLTGVVRGEKHVSLQEQKTGGSWTQLKVVSPVPRTGAIRINVTPTETTEYRLANAAAAAAYIRIRVTSG
jgi:stage II sporulation protein D